MFISENKKNIYIRSSNSLLYPSQFVYAKNTKADCFKKNKIYESNGKCGFSKPIYNHNSKFFFYYSLANFLTYSRNL